MPIRKEKYNYINLFRIHFYNVMLDCGMQCDTKISLREAHSTVPDLKEQRAPQRSQQLSGGDSQLFDEVKAPQPEDEMRKNSDHLQKPMDVPPKGNVKNKVKNFEFLKTDEVSLLRHDLDIDNRHPQRF